MSGGLHSWYSLSDLMVLAGRAAVLEGKIPLVKLERLADLLNSTDGDVAARMAFRLSRDDTLLMELQCAARVEMVCQRCLRPVVKDVGERVDFVIADKEDSLAVVPQGLELVTLDGDRFQPAQLIEDELIVSLPLVPRHGNDDTQGEN